MNMLSSAPRFTHLTMAGALALGLATLSGCGIGTPSTISESMPMATFNGKVHGGQQPVTNSTIQIWTVGTTGYGSAGTNLLGSTVVKTSLTDGSFNVTGSYTCPSATALVYVTATGGNPGLTVGTNNAAIKLAAPLGQCGNLGSSTFIVIDEVTTAAAALALGQYFTPTLGASSTDTFGAPNTTQAQVGIANAFATVNNLVNTASGNAVTSSTITGSAGTVTATPESDKLNTIADILAACVNSDGSGTSPCQTTLFPDVTPTGGVQPTDTLQAAVDMSLNPTSNNASGSPANLTALYGLQTAQSPFVGAVAQPTDWTVGILYTSAALMGQPQNIAADASGNIWVQTITTGLLELSPTGSPLANPLNSSTVGSGTVNAGPRNLAIDTAGNVWVTTSTSTALIYKYFTASTALSSFPTSKSSYGLAIDGNNNVFVGSASTSSHFELFEFPGADITKPIEYPIASSTPGTAGTNGQNLFVLPQYLAFDTSGSLWMSNGAATSGTSSNAVVQLSNIDASACIGAAVTYPCLLSTSPTLNTFTQINQGSPAAPFGLAANTNSMWYANSTTGTNTVTALSLTGATVNSGTAFGSATSITSPRFLAVDGGGNVWVADKNASPGSVSELSSTGTILSPVNSGTAPFTAIGFNHVDLNLGNGVAIDPSGNVWIPNNATSGADLNSVFELVGAAVPTVTPIASALATSSVAKKP